MQTENTLAQWLAIVRILVPLLTQAITKLTGLWLRQPWSYENRLIDLTLDIRDKQGRVAVLAKHQQITTRARDVVIRDLAWGDGELLARYSAAGVKRLGVRTEGARRAIMLAPTKETAPSSVLALRTSRFIRGGFTEREEYFDMLVERPTALLRLKVLFPKSRPPKNARLVREGPDEAVRPLAVRYSAKGRAAVSWHTGAPVQYRTYSFRWSW